MKKLLQALDQNHTEIVNYETIKSLLEEEISFSALELTDGQGNTAFLKACGIPGAVEIVELLCDYGCNVHAINKQKDGAVCIAGGFGDSDIIEFLVRQKQLSIEELGQNKRTPAMKACSRKGNLECLKKLIEIGIKSDFGVNLKKKDVDDMSCINLASKLGDVAMVEFLVGCKIDGVCQIDYEELGFNGRTPFLNACSEKHNVDSSFEN